MSIEQAWNYLTESGTATDEELALVTSGWGNTMETLETVLYVRTGYRGFDQVEF